MPGGPIIFTMAGPTCRVSIAEINHGGTTLLKSKKNIVVRINDSVATPHRMLLR
jgi:hypothetical protein